MIRGISPVAGNTHRRRYRRAHAHTERGAAVFLVVLILSLLTAMGIFALRSASLADVAAGFDREGAQASLIAQYGITATAAYVGTDYADTIVVNMRAKLPFIMPRCESNGPPMTTPQTDPAAPCYLMTQAALQSRFTVSSNESIFAPTNKGSAIATSTSSLNVNEKTDATFNVELTELAATGVVPGGYDPNQRVQYAVTLTSIAQVRPIEACSGAVQATPNAAQAVVRSIITFGGPP
ncbi:MAG: hypothetical protein ABJB12_20140 [Pseudomonadota bacterium]